jgi:hypothetical protein
MRRLVTRMRRSGRDRLLPREQVEGPLLELTLQRVDGLVGRDDALGQARSASSSAVVARLIAEPASRVISTSSSLIASSSSWKWSRMRLLGRRCASGQARRAG